ncbi:FAD-dependent oxidoreductase [Pseudaminobacter sp. 19-2017]|uniref:FAD-dependent oxidoreductase n=1 Tax=Pseudaminobacter soli (ex Zhang et al. 2022) TaxID=2831468 RepID=A0A942E866_9HYPH|nr:NAD(P)/FAD-dependent oxidoreductase [Pseudaminobacter soli]MBS3650202.1 FAD-dependent oxidoreductase [Pseudaminobacter soli]
MSRPVVIIGAGPAGLSCAWELASAGREVVLIDDNGMAGGQYFRQLPETYQVSRDARLLRDKARFDELAKVLTLPGVRYLSSTVVWGAPGNKTVAYAGPTSSGRIEASAIVIATGAQEKSLPFPGWTLPGIISAGGCLNLAKAHGMVPTGRVVVAGNGPLVLVAAATLIAAGAEVVGVVEAQSDIRLASAAVSGLFAAPGVLRTGIGYRARIMAARAGFRTGWMVAGARGKDRLTAVGIAPVGADGRPRRDKQQWIEADALVVGYGLLPGTETARLFGCRTEHNPALNGLVPWRDDTLRTSEEGIYAIGDGAGIGGVEVALLEGRIAAHSIMGTRAPASLASRYRRLDGYRRKLNLAYRMPQPLLAATDDTIICRCEELTLGRLLADPGRGRNSLNAVKTSSRLGMGRCQGRNCLHVASSLLGLATDDLTTHPRARPPLKPLAVGLLAADKDAGSAMEPDEITLSE